MKKITVHQWDGMLLSLFQMDAGDKIERHNHKKQGITHTTGVAKGMSEVEIWSDPPQKFIMKPHDKDFVFDMETDHEITALEDGTIIVNLSHSQTPTGEPAQDGGLMLEDGTIV
jgi:hypothetical protein